MIQISQEEIQKWRVEIDADEQFRDEEFGKYGIDEKTKAGENIDYIEHGFGSVLAETNTDRDNMALINIPYVIQKNIIPTLYYKNPYILSFPKRRKPDDELSAPYAGGILNYYQKELDLKQEDIQIIFDAYNLGLGVCKLGYTTKFGQMPTEESLKEEKKSKEKEKKKGLLERVGLKKTKKGEEAKQNPELHEYIRSENPFSVWVSPFKFGMHRYATSIYDSPYVFEQETKRLSDVKADKNFANTENLQGTLMPEAKGKKIADVLLDQFKTVELYSIQYKTDEGLNLLVLAKDGESSKALYHDKLPHNVDGFLYELLYFNKNKHKLYTKSDISKIKPLQDRINLTVESILDQVDRYVPKLFVWEQGVTEQGKQALLDGEIGSIVYTNENPNTVVKEGSFTQLKADLLALVDKLLEIIMLETGLTKAQLMGMTQAETATEAQIGQAGQNLRLSDKFDAVNSFLNRRSRKLWQIIKQFVDLEEISLIVGESGIDESTGLPKYSWLPDINNEMASKLSKGEYRFEIEMGSTEKPDLPILRKQVENFVNILGGKGVLQAVAAQGYKIELVEILREYLNLFPNMFKNPGRIIKPIENPMQAGVPQEQPQQGGARGMGVKPQMVQANAPNTADIISSMGGEKGNIPIA